MLQQLAKINETIRRHNLSSVLGWVGALAFIISTPTLLMSVFVLSLGHVAFNPPSAIDPIIEAGWGFIFNRWFWSTVFFGSVVIQIFAYWSHPEAQLHRKIGAEAVAKYKQENDWPWL